MTISPKCSTKLIIAFRVSLRQQQKFFLNPISKCFTNTVGNGQCENGLTPTLQTITHTTLHWTQICHIPHAKANTDTHIESILVFLLYIYMLCL